jgi:hypothetical protein
MANQVDATTRLSEIRLWVRDVGFPAAIACALLYMLDQHLNGLTAAVLQNQVTLIEVQQTIHRFCH